MITVAAHDNARWGDEVTFTLTARAGSAERARALPTLVALVCFDVWCTAHGASGRAIAGVAALGAVELGRDGHVAVRDAMLRYATGGARSAVEGWLAEGGDAARGVGVELLARWRDPRAAQVASRAVRRGTGVLRAAGACAMGRAGEALAEETVTEVMAACAKEPAWAEEVLDATVHAAPATALAVALRARSRLGGVTGDVLGAGVEISLAAALTVAVCLG